MKQLTLYDPPRDLNFDKMFKYLRSPFLLRKQYDIVHSLHYSSLFFEPLNLKLFSRAGFVFTKTNLQWANHPLNWRIKSFLSDRIISISEEVNKLIFKKGFDFEECINNSW